MKRFKYQVILISKGNSTYYTNDFVENAWHQLVFTDEVGINHYYHGYYDIIEGNFGEL